MKRVRRSPLCWRTGTTKQPWKNSMSIFVVARSGCVARLTDEPRTSGLRAGLFRRSLTTAVIFAERLRELHMAHRKQKNVGVIGLGIIGSRVTDSLRRKGLRVFVW